VVDVLIHALQALKAQQTTRPTASLAKATVGLNQIGG
jgi:hypothetical protein